VLNVDKFLGKLISLTEEAKRVKEFNAGCFSISPSALKAIMSGWV